MYVVHGLPLECVIIHFKRIHFMVAYAHECGSPRRPKEGVRAPGAGATHVCELADVGTGANHGPVQSSMLHHAPAC